VIVALVAVEPVFAFAAVQLAPASVERSIRYPTIAEPPLDIGAVHERETAASLGVATRFVGCPATPEGVAATAVEVGPDPPAFSAVIRNLYAVPFTKPATVTEIVGTEATAVVQVVPPSVDDSTLYPVMSDPPFEFGADQESVTAESDATATGVPVAPGVVYGVADAIADAAPRPLTLAAEMRKA